MNKQTNKLQCFGRREPKSVLTVYGGVKILSVTLGIRGETPNRFLISLFVCSMFFLTKM